MANSLTDTIKQCNFKPCYTINSAKKIHDELSLKIKTTRYWLFMEYRNIKEKY